MNARQNSFVELLAWERYFEATTESVELMPFASHATLFFQQLIDWRRESANLISLADGCRLIEGLLSANPEVRADLEQALDKAIARQVEASQESWRQNDSQFIEGPLAQIDGLRQVVSLLRAWAA